MAKMKLFHKTRANRALTHEEVKQIKLERNMLKEQMKREGTYTKDFYEQICSERGLYFDKSSVAGFVFSGKGLATATAASAIVLTAMYGLSTVTEMRGLFTVNLSQDLFREGYALFDTADFTAPFSVLYSDPSDDTPCISIVQIPEDIDETDGCHNGTGYLAYTFYIRNEGEYVSSYDVELDISDEYLNLGDGLWVLVFKDGEATIYAKKSADGNAETLPTAAETRRGYRLTPFIDSLKDKNQYTNIYTSKSGVNYYSLTSVPFYSDSIVMKERQEDVEPLEYHKYTVVIWLEGDDPECTNDKIGSYAGLDVNFTLVEDEEE